MCRSLHSHSFQQQPSLQVLLQTALSHAAQLWPLPGPTCHYSDCYCPSIHVQQTAGALFTNLAFIADFQHKPCLRHSAVTPCMHVQQAVGSTFQLKCSAFVAGPPAYNPVSGSPAVAAARPRYSPSQSPERPSTSSSTADVLSFLYDAPGQAQSQQPPAVAPPVAAAAAGRKAPLYQPPSQPHSSEASGVNAWASQVILMIYACIRHSHISPLC